MNNRTHPAEAALNNIPAARLDRVQNALSCLAQYGDVYIVPTESGELIAVAEGWQDERRAERIAAAAGANLGWHENYVSCDNCGVYIEVNPHFADGDLIWIGECAPVCRHCLEAVPGMVTAQLEELARQQQYSHYEAPGYAVEDPAQHGYVEVRCYRYSSDLPQCEMPWQSGAFVAQAFGKFSKYGQHDRYALYVPARPNGQAATPPAYDVQVISGQWAVMRGGEPIAGLTDYGTEAEAIAAAWEVELFGDDE